MRTVRLLSPILIPLFLIGCGSGGGDAESNAVSKLAASEECIGCHTDAVSPGTALAIAEEWHGSTHNSRNGAGCADCHEPAPGHPNSCDACHAGGGTPTGDEVSRNPDAAGKCSKCHGLQFPGDVMARLAPQHFGNMTASALNTKYRASYVSSQYRNNCIYCHNPHDPTTHLAIARQWAASPHGDTTAYAYAGYDFKTRGTEAPMSTTFGANCVRCHTSTGYLNFVKSGFLDVRAWGSDGDKTKEVTACNVCHDNGSGRAYGFAVRAVAPYRAFYNFSSAKSSPTVKLNNSPVLYPDASRSNLCMPCHAGRGIGALIHDAAAAGLDFSNTNSPSSHYRPAGAILFRKGGYEFAGRNYVPSYFLHGKIGMADEHGTGNSGPCITCHLNSDTSHSFLPIAKDASGAIAEITSKTCAKCHIGAYALTPAFLQAEKEGFSAALALLNVLKYDPSLAADPLNPSRSKVRPLPNRNSDYDAAFPGNGANTMGAFFNAGLLQSDPGAFAHNRIYAKRLIYDSIDWLNDGVLDGDVEEAINGATLAVNSSTGKVSLANPAMGGYYVAPQSPGTAPDAALAAVRGDAIRYLLGAPGGGRP